MRKIKLVYKKGTFLWALEQLYKGKKVYRKHLRNSFKYLYSSGVCIFDENEQEYALNFFDIRNEDWEIYKEK